MQVDGASFEALLVAFLCDKVYYIFDCFLYNVKPLAPFPETTLKIMDAYRTVNVWSHEKIFPLCGLPLYGSPVKQAQGPRPKAHQ